MLVSSRLKAVGIFRRGGDSEPWAQPREEGFATSDGEARRVTEFVGIGEELGRAQTRRTGLYEFRTTSGARVYLHDTDLLRVTEDIGLPGRLLLVFEYDSEWVPPELVATPAITFECEGATILEWEVDREVAVDGDAPQGQVSCFDWDGQDGFSLQTYSQYIAFTARRISVTVTASQRT